MRPETWLESYFALLSLIDIKHKFCSWSSISNMFIVCVFQQSHPSLFSPLVPNNYVPPSPSPLGLQGAGPITPGTISTEGLGLHGGASTSTGLGLGGPLSNQFPLTPAAPMTPLSINPTTPASESSGIVPQLQCVASSVLKLFIFFIVKLKFSCFETM